MEFEIQLVHTKAVRKYYHHPWRETLRFGEARVFIVRDFFTGQHMVVGYTNWGDVFAFKLSTFAVERISLFFEFHSRLLLQDTCDDFNVGQHKDDM
mmetsp:Transcript_44383/g.92840  ORF Transcript_44383/g.92840 Transcript_44383/m.92840 type:complete len:96 (+) Transcript_44383:237-524(+)